MCNRLLIAALLLAPTLAAAQTREPVTHVDEGATRAASEGLSTLRALLQQAKNFREMGFESQAELDRATLGQPLGTSRVRLDELSAFQAGGDPMKLLHDAREALYPVEVDGKVRSSVTVAATEKGWTARAFGAPNRTQLVTQARARAAEVAAVPPTGTALVEVPAMKLVFIGFLKDGALWLAPVLDNPSFGFKANEPVKADEVFKKLAPASKAFRDAPG
ncbi:MAG: hypothetical protein QM767_28805 [Anaeromyxobacter sp.]